MFYQLSNKNRASELNLEDNELLKPFVESFSNSIMNQKLDDVVLFMETMDKLNFKNKELYEKCK